MIGNITLQMPPTIEFGPGKIRSLPGHLENERKIYMLVDKPVLHHLEPLLEVLRQSGKELMVSSDIVPEPPISSLDNLLGPARDFKPDCVVGIGGGSTMDCAKLVAVLHQGRQRTEEVIGIDNVAGRKVKLVAAATTSGTGSEVTPIAVLTDTEAGLKKGIVSRHIIPDIAIVDPELTTGMGKMLTAVTGMDAITHCIEAYTNRFSHPVIDALAMEGIRLMYHNLHTAVNDGNDLAARSAMALGSLYGGLCLGPVNTGAVHALAYPLGGLFKVSHGMSNSVLLPFVMNFNLPACITKYSNIARLIGLEGEAENDLARQAIRAIRELSNRCEIPGNLAELHIPRESIEKMSEAALLVQRLLQNNPREVLLDDARAIYTAAFAGDLE
jgi:alcohol dehydrogenase class IV